MQIHIILIATPQCTSHPHRHRLCLCSDLQIIRAAAPVTLEGGHHKSYNISMNVINTYSIAGRQCIQVFTQIGTDLFCRKLNRRNLGGGHEHGNGMLLFASLELWCRAAGSRECHDDPTSNNKGGGGHCSNAMQPELSRPAMQFDLSTVHMLHSKCLRIKPLWLGLRRATCEKRKRATTCTQGQPLGTDGEHNHLESSLTDHSMLRCGCCSRVH